MGVDLAIVGAGVSGLSAAWRSASAGLRVALFERDVPGSTGGSSHGATRIFRLAYDHADYVSLARAARPYWRDLETDPGSLLRVTGGLDVGPPEALRPCVDALQAAEAPFRLLEPGDRAREFPWLSGREDWWGLASPDAGVIAASRTISALVLRVREAGGSITAATTVTSISPVAGGVEVRAGGEVVRARRCVVAAGAWAAPLLAPLGIDIPLRVTREQVSHFPGDGPPIPVIERGDVLRYVVPAMHGAPGTKVGEHGLGVETSADERTFEPDDAVTARLRDWVARALPGLDPDPVGTETCLYTTTPDEDFVLDAVGPIVVLSPCSGHGFKFAPLIGEVAACLVRDVEPPVPIERFRLARFGTR